MKKFIFIFILILNQNIFAQEVNGIIYDSKGVVADFRVLNETRNIYSKTNAEGFFTIESNPGDTLLFKSLIYQEKTLIVTEENFKQTLVVELKNAVNSLNQVNISSSPKELNVEKANRQIKKDILTDREKNWFLYEIPESKGNIYDGLVSVINKLFPKKPEVKTIQLSDYQELFTSDANLNFEYLSENLKIPKNQYNLFFDYLESKSLNYDLLAESRRLELIEKIDYLAKEYKEMIQTSE